MELNKITCWNQIRFILAFYTVLLNVGKYLTLTRRRSRHSSITATAVATTAFAFDISFAILFYTLVALLL
jgi:hypothetical protein